MGPPDAPLTTEEIALYRDRGYLVPDYQLADDVLFEMREAYDKLLGDNAGVTSDFMLGPHMEKPGRQGIVGSRRWLDFCRNPDILDRVAQLIGPDIVLWGTTIFGKPARKGMETPWHQDGDYYPIRPLETLSVWIALDDADCGNGCMRFIPGSHKTRQTFSHHWVDGADLTIRQVCDPEHFDPASAYDLVLKAGQLSFHDVYMIHGSHANRSGRRRAAFVIRLMPAWCHYDHALGREMSKQHAAHDYGGRPLFLLRGEDRCGRNDFSIGHGPAPKS